MRKKVILICTLCLSRNYSVTRHKDESERLATKKYCKQCKKHTIHKESK